LKLPRATEKKQLHEFGIAVPRRTLEKFDQLKGKYLSRNMFILKVLDEFIARQEQQEKEKAAPSPMPEKPISLEASW
jgi:metal-responsive CopG/Arc/MetJ family transcriptional regulator